VHHENKLFSEKGKNKPKAILLMTLVFGSESGDQITVDRDYLIKELMRRKITVVNKKSDGSQTVDPVWWINRVYGGKESNYAWLLFFLTIFHEYVFSRDNDGKQYFAWKHIGRKKLESLVSNSKGQLTVAIDILVKTEIIEHSPKYSAKATNWYSEAFTKSFKIHNRWKTWEPTYGQISEVDTRGIIDAKKWLIKQEDAKRKQPPECPWLRDVIEENILAIDITDDAVCAYNDMRAKEGKKPAKKSVVQTVHSFAALSLRNSPKQQEVWNVYAGHNGGVGRVFHTLSNFPSGMRSHLSYKGSPILQIDVKSAHAFLLVCLYDRALEWKEKIFASLSEADMSRLPSRINKERKLYLTRFNYKNDFYATAGKLSGIEREHPKQTDKAYRKMVKAMFWPFVYGRPEKNKGKCLFTDYYAKRTNFPLLLKTINWMKENWWMLDNPQKYHEAIKNIVRLMPIQNRERELKGKKEGLNPSAYEPMKWKQVPHKQLSYEMHILEGDIMINGVCAELAKWKPQKPKDPKHIWFIPNHDAIWIQQSAEWAVKRVMTKHWSKHIGEIPKWDTTLFVPED
jgi:hypothetical protein